MTTTLGTSTPGQNTTQTATQDPQTSTGQSLQSTSDSTVARSSSSGVALESHTVSSVALPTASVSTAAPAQSSEHHLNGGLITIAVLFFIVAIVLFASTFSPVKNTTD